MSLLLKFYPFYFCSLGSKDNTCRIWRWLRSKECIIIYIQLHHHPLFLPDIPSHQTFPVSECAWCIVVILSVLHELNNTDCGRLHYMYCVSFSHTQIAEQDCSTIISFNFLWVESEPFLFLKKRKKCLSESNINDA